MTVAYGLSHHGLCRVTPQRPRDSGDGLAHDGTLEGAHDRHGNHVLLVGAGGVASAHRPGSRHGRHRGSRHNCGAVMDNCREGFEFRFEAYRAVPEVMPADLSPHGCSWSTSIRWEVVRLADMICDDGLCATTILRVWPLPFGVSNSGR